MHRGTGPRPARAAHDAGRRARRRMPRLPTLMLALGAVSLVAAACGSSPTAAKKKSSTTTSSATTTSTTAAPASATTTSAAPATTAPLAKHTATTVAPKASTACSSTGGPLSAACDTQSPSFKLAGAGANSIQPFFTRVFYYYSQADKAVSANYSPAGSSVGVTDIEQNTVNFGDSVGSPGTELEFAL